MKDYDGFTREETIRELQTTVAASDRLLHELRVHQAELEAQNEELRHAQQLIEESRDRYSKLYDFAPSALLSVDARGCIRGINLTGAALLGAERDYLLGRPFVAVVGLGSSGPFFAHLKKALASDRTVTELAFKTRKGRELVVEAASTPFREPAGEILLWMAFTDVTARKAAQQAIEEAHRRKDEFLAMLAHELRNPLAPIANAAQLLKVEAPGLPELQRLQQVIERQVRHLSRLVDDLLDVARITSGKVALEKQLVNVAAAIASAVEAARPAIEAKRHTLEVTSSVEPLAVEADPTRLVQVMGNLLSNAVKYTREGGHIRLSSERDGDQLVLKVSDTGVGIAPDMLPRIFDLFVQVDRSLERSQGGLGIGLALVRRLVALHGGTVGASSAGLERGSEFVVRLPGVTAAERVEAPAALKLPVVARERLRILVVDDNEDSAETLADILRLQGHDVESAHDGFETLRLVSSFRPRIVLLDIGLPGMNGFEVARRLRAGDREHAIVVVALTGYGQETDRARTREAGFDYHLVKPFDIETIDDLLESLPREGPRRLAS